MKQDSRMYVSWIHEHVMMEGDLLWRYLGEFGVYCFGTV